MVLVCPMDFKSIGRSVQGPEEVRSPLPSFLSEIVEGSKIKMTSHTISLNREQNRLSQEIEKLVLANGYEPTKISRIYLHLEHDQETIDYLLLIFIEQGVLIRLSLDTIIHGEVIKKLKEMVTEYIKKKGSITVIGFRENLVNQGRKKIIGILEYFDSIGFTRRIGDMRVLKDSNFTLKDNRLPEIGI